MSVVETSRLVLSRPTVDDIDALFAIGSDARVWQHFPSGRHTSPVQTRVLVERWLDSWDKAGLGPWVVRRRDSAHVIGYGGCTLLDGGVWNLGYRLAADEHGRG